MKKWEKPELKTLGVENTLDGILPAHVEAGEGLVWICAVCKAHPVNDISDQNHYIQGEGYTSDTKCHCGNNIWIKAPANGQYECNMPGHVTPIS
ncbi:hypothetical protein H6A19_12180 [Clostridium saudiense]|uniref:PAAR domain-containing protein n=1 Tax=Clostridium saudiense TaxID=1414720 RepID=A0ABS2FHY2_9CLOT|nr:hypothetical protein [Clostridium saudiense]MBM6820084.1 hypothetical protein [Clostridium saudiense]